MSDKILNIEATRLTTAVTFTVDAIINVVANPVEFPKSISRCFRIVVTSNTVTGNIVPTIIETDDSTDFTNATDVSLLQTYARGGLNGQDAIDKATITAAKVTAGEKEYFIACNPTKKYFGLKLTGTGTATGIMDVDIIYMPEYLPVK